MTRRARDAPDATPAAGTVVRVRAGRGDAGVRLDHVLVRHVRDVSRLSRTQVQQWIERGAVTIDGRPARRASSRVRAGAELTIAVPAGAPRRVRPAAEARPLEILYEDASLIAVNKPPGVVVHPTYRQQTGTLLNAVLWHLRGRPDAQPGILTRLDKGTSGLVVIALDATTHAALQRDGSRGLVRKEYLAIVRGVPRPRQGRIVQPLARDPRDRRRVIVSPAGAPSETRYEVADARRAPDGSPSGRASWIALVRCDLVTGRTHQIRVHLSWRGWPILGDPTYGTPHPPLARQALHAWRLTLPHPHSREPITLTAPLPDDLARFALEPPDAVRTPE